MKNVQRTVTTYVHVFGKMKKTKDGYVVDGPVEVRELEPYKKRQIAQLTGPGGKLEGLEFISVRPEKAMYSCTLEQFLTVAEPET